MAPAVELEKSSTPPARCLAFIKSEPTFEFPCFPKSTPSRTKDSSRTSREEYRGDISSEVGAFHGANLRPKSAVGTRDRRTSSSPTCRLCSTHPRLQRGFRVPMRLRGEQWARPPQFNVGREPLHGFPLRPPGMKLAGRGGPRRGGPPCCPRCECQPCGRPFGGRLGARCLPLRASMVPNGSAALRPFVGMAPRRPPLLPRPGTGMIPRGLKLPSRAGVGMAPIGSRLPPRSVAGMTSRWPRPPPPGFPRGPRAPMYAGMGRKTQSERRVIMDPRMMAGRGRGRPPWPEEAMELRGELPLPNPDGHSPTSDIFTAAPSWMSALRNDGDFMQPVPVSESTPKDESASPSQDAALKSAVAKAEPAPSIMPPWAKPYVSKAEGSAPNRNSGEIDGHEVSSPEKESLSHCPWYSSPPSRQDGVPDWLQSIEIAGTPMIATAAQTSERDMSAVAKDGEGGLDWMKAAISLDTKSASTPNTAAPVHKSEDESTAARVVGDSSNRASAKTWLESTFKGKAPRDLDPPGAVNANAWLSQVVSGAGGAGASCGSTTKSAMKPEGPSVAPGDWMSAKFGLRTDEDEEKDGQSVHFRTSASVVGTKVITSVGALGSWLTSGKLGVSVDDEEDEQGKTHVSPVAGAIKKEKKQKDAVIADKKNFPSVAAQASGAPGGWIAQAVSPGVLGAPQNIEEQESGDKPNNRQTEATLKVSSVERRRRSSLDGGMPSWAAKPPSKDPSIEENIAKAGELSGGRPPWAPAPPVLLDKPAKEPPSSGEKVDHSSEVARVDGISDDGCGLPTWLASVANSGGNRKELDGNGGKRQEQSELFAPHAPPPSPQDILIAALSGKSVAATPSAQVIPATSKVPAGAPAKLITDDTNGAAGLSWLEMVVDSGGKSKKARSDTSSGGLLSSSKHKLAPQEPNVQGNWLTSGKLGVPIEVQSDEEAETEGIAKIAAPGKQGVDFVSAKAEGKMKNNTERKAVDYAREPTAQSAGGKTWLAKTSKIGVKKVGVTSLAKAGGSGSWLESGSLGVPVDDGSEGESEGKCEGGGGEGVTLISEETQTEDDIDQIVKRGTHSKLPPWAKPWTSPQEPKKRVDHSSPKSKKKKRGSAVPATPDWILKSLGPIGHDANLVPVKSVAACGPDWLNQAVVNGGAGGDGSAGAKPRKKQPRKPPANVPSCAPSWMTKMKRRSSMDLEDPEVEASIAEAKAKAVPGGWMQLGALGAPDSVEEAKALEDARAASSLHRSNYEPSGSNDAIFCPTSARRPSLSGGAPTWAPKEPPETDKSGEASGERRPSLTGGLPPWAPVQNQEQAAVLTESAPSTSRRPSLDGGMPAWAPTSTLSTDTSRRPSLGGGMPPWAPASEASSAKMGSTSLTHVDTKYAGKDSSRRECDSGKQLPQRSTVPDWLAEAAGATSGEEVTKATVRTSLAVVVDIQEGSGNGDETRNGGGKGGGLHGLAQIAPGHGGNESVMPLMSITRAESSDGDVAKLDTLKYDEANDVDGGSNGGLHWLRAASSTDQETRNKWQGPVTDELGSTLRPPATSIVTPTAPGVWLTSGKLSIPTGDESEEEQQAPGAPKAMSPGKQGLEVSSKTQKKKQERIESNVVIGMEDSSPQPVGWLAEAISLGKFGVCSNNSDERDDQSGEARDRPKMTTSSTQWEDGDTMDTPEIPKSRLPPWAKEWTPPCPGAPRKVDKEGKPKSEEKQRTTGVDWIKGGTTSVQVEISKSSGLDWLKDVAASGSSSHAAVAGAGGPLANAVSKMPGPAMVASAPQTKEAISGESGLDWLAAMATLGQKQLGPRCDLEVAKLEGRTSLATEGGGWLTSVKLGILSEEDNKIERCHDGDLGNRGSDPRSGKLSAAGVKRVSELLTTLVRELGGWFASGSLGNLVDDENGGELKEKCGGGGGLLTHRSEETQTEDDIEGIVKKGTESKLPPRAKPWSPIQGPGKTVDCSSPQAKAEEKQDSATAVTPDWILKSMESTGDGIDVSPVECSAVVTDGRGVDWLPQAVDPAEAAGRDTKVHGPDWLQEAVVSCGVGNNVSASAEAQKNHSINATAGGWLASGKLDILVGNEPYQDDPISAGRPTYDCDARTAYDAKQGTRDFATREKPVPLLPGPTCWLTSGSLGFLADAATDHQTPLNAVGCDYGCTALVMAGTQTEEDLGLTVNARDGSRLPSSATPWAAIPDSTEVSTPKSIGQVAREKKIGCETRTSNYAENLNVSAGSSDCRSSNVAAITVRHGLVRRRSASADNLIKDPNRAIFDDRLASTGPGLSATGSNNSGEEALSRACNVTVSAVLPSPIRSRVNDTDKEREPTAPDGCFVAVNAPNSVNSSVSIEGQTTAGKMNLETHSVPAERPWEGKAGKASQPSAESHLLLCRDSFTDSKASVKNVTISVIQPEESAPATAVGDASTEKTEERKHGNCVPSAGNSQRPRPKLFNHTCASVKNVASSFPPQEEASATTAKETASEYNQEETQKQRVPSRLSSIQPVGLQEIGCATRRKETEEIAQVAEAMGKSSTGIQCGNTITGAAPVSVVGTTLGIQVDLGIECVEASGPGENIDGGTWITRGNGGWRGYYVSTPAWTDDAQ